MPRTTRTALLLLAPIVALSSSILAHEQPKTFALESLPAFACTTSRPSPRRCRERRGFRSLARPQPRRRRNTRP